ncbi:MAG: hypothetical protein SYC29_14730, partial [Planctomycetota bacterium]|nr:hypothetical protein [Planctomycetota bacterium]
MSDLHHILRRAARRELAQRMLRRSGLGLIAGLALGCFLLGADRLGLLAVSGLTYVLVAALGAIAGAATAMLAGPDRLALAVRLDRAYRLDDRLATAESLQRGSGRGQDAAFAALVGREADRLAGTLDVRPALPVRIPRLWGGAAALATLLAIGALFLPAVDPARRADAAEIRQREEAQREERASVADSIRDVVEDLEAEAALDETTKEELDALDALAGQLSGENAEDFDPAAARDESAARINELADRLAEQAEKDAAAVEELTERFAGLDSPEAPMSAEEFSEALRRGEFGRAADLLDEMMRNRDAMTEEERQAVADHLRTLGQNIEDTARSEDPGLDQRRDGLEDALRDQGLTEDEIDRLLDPQEPRTEDVQRDLESRNVDEEVSRELAEDIDELRRQRQTEEQANREAQNVADAVRRAAESMETDRRRETPPAGEGAAK